MTPPRSSPGAGGGNGRLRPASRLSPGRDPSSDGNGGPSIAETTSAHHLHQTSTNVSPHAGLPRMRLDTPFTGLRSSHMPRKGFTNSPLSDGLAPLTRPRSLIRWKRRTVNCGNYFGASSPPNVHERFPARGAAPHAFGHAVHGLTIVSYATQGLHKLSSK